MSQWLCIVASLMFFVRVVVKLLHSSQKLNRTVAISLFKFVCNSGKNTISGQEDHGFSLNSTKVSMNVKFLQGHFELQLTFFCPFLIFLFDFFFPTSSSHPMQTGIQTLI